MRYSAAEKYEIIQLVEQSELSVRQTLAHLDIHKSTFYNRLRRYRDHGMDGLDDMRPVTESAWNKIPAVHRTAIIDLALAEPQLSPRELAVTYTDDKSYFVLESSVYRLLKAQDLITSPAYSLMQASDKNYERYHESLKNLTPADMFYGRAPEILDRREKVKRNTLAVRRKMHYVTQAKQLTQMG